MKSGSLSPPGKRWQRLVANANWNVLSFLLALAVNFLSIPIVIANIGLESFGAGGLILALVSPCSLVGTVLAQALVRELPALLAERSHDRARRLTGAAVVLTTIGCGGVFAFFLVLGEAVFQRVFSGVAIVEVVPAGAIALLGWGAQQFMLVLQSSLSAAQRFKAYALLQAAVAVISALSLVAATYLLPSAYGFLWGSSIGFLVGFVLSLLVVSLASGYGFPISRPSRADFRVLLAIGKWQSVTQLFGALALQGDRYALAALAPIQVVGKFNVAMRLQEVVYMGLLKLSEVLYPHFSLTANEAPERRARFLLAATWITNVLAAASLMPLIVFAEPLVTLWVGGEAAEGGAQLLRTLATAGILGCGINVFVFFAMGAGDNYRLALMAFWHSLLVLAVGVGLIITIGPMAAGGGFVVANLVRLCWSGLVTSEMLKRVVSTREVLSCTWPPLGIGILVAWLAVAGFSWSATSWITLAGQYALAATATVVFCLLGGLGLKESRVLILDLAQTVGLRRPVG